MRVDIIQCECCGKTLTPEEAEVGMSLVCPICDEKLRKTAATKAKSLPQKGKKGIAA
jgi:hypothetical protein